MVKKIKFCPECGSPDIEWVLPHVWSKWRCKHCGYIGVFILEDGEIADELKKQWEKKK